MPPKKKHTKTRTGCKTCRVRRIKCDEERPKCRNCTRREIECAYFNHPEPSRPPGIEQAIQGLVLSPEEWGRGVTGGGRLGLEGPPRYGDPGGDEGSSSRSPPPCPPLLTTKLEMTNLELLHHFTTRTYKTLSLDEDLREMWRLDVPRIAFSYEFVMHALLAMSALHLDFLGSPDKSYAVAAAGHHGKALGSLRTAFPAQNKEHVEALYAASVLTARYVFACPPVVGGLLPRARTWIPVFRGVMAIVQRGCAWMLQGRLVPLLAQRMARVGLNARDCIEFPSSLFDLSKRGAPGELDPEELEDDHVLEVYHKETAALKISWDLFWTIDPKESAMLRWPCTMSDDFVSYIVERRPRALVLLAHYCVLMELIDEQYWWIRGKGMDEIKGIECVLEGKWKGWLEWPIANCRVSKGTG